METTTNRTTNIGLTYGLITGLAICLITLVQYLGGLKTYMSPIGFLTYILLVVMAVVAAQKQKKINEGYLSFGEALKVTFSVIASALLLQTLFTYVLLNFIDPSFKQALLQASLNASEAFLRKMGMSENTIDEAMEKARETDSMSLPSMLFGYALWCIAWFVVCLIISAIVKKNKPEFPTT